MKPRMKLLLVAVGLLVLVNLWRWWPQPEPASAASGQSTERPASSLELRLAGYDPEAAGGEVNIRRDLFFPVGQDKPAKEASQKTVSEPSPPPKTNSRREQIVQELKQYKLVGVLTRNGVRRGFLVREDKNFSVRQGDRLENRYSVEDISLTSITLSDPATRVSHKIELE